VGLRLGLRAPSPQGAGPRWPWWAQPSAWTLSPGPTRKQGRAAATPGGPGAEAEPCSVSPGRAVPARLLSRRAFRATACPQAEWRHHCMKGPCGILVLAGQAPWAKGWPGVCHHRPFLTLEMAV